jgi:site-specific DNA-methyltransferase (adenine-specific)
MKTGEGRNGEMSSATGRWPANLVHDGSDDALAGFPQANGGHHPAARGRGGIGQDGHKGQDALDERFSDEGTAARFFYCAKAGKLDRLGSKHPTVKPVALMRWLVRLITPPGGTVLDPFAGTGSTGIAAFVEGFDSILIDLREEATADIERRLAHIKGLGRRTACELATHDDEEKRAKARGDDMPLFGQPT